MKKLLLVALIVTFSFSLASAQGLNKVIFGPRVDDGAGVLVATAGQETQLELWLRTDPTNPDPGLTGVAHGLAAEIITVDLDSCSVVPEYNMPNWESVFNDGPWFHDPADPFPIPDGFKAWRQTGVYQILGSPPGDPIDTDGGWLLYGHWGITISPDVEIDQTYCPFQDGWAPFSNQGTAWTWQGGGVIPEREFACIYITPNVDPEFTVCPQGGCADAGFPVCFDVAGIDLNETDDLHINLVGGPGYFTEEVGGPGGEASGTWCWDEPVAGDYVVVLEITDGAGGSATCEFAVNVSDITLEIACLPGFPGGVVVVPVTLHTCGFLTGGIEALIMWDPTALHLMDVQPLSRIDFGNEYFYWNEGDPCNPPCDEGGAVRVTWISDMNNGIPHAPAPPGDAPVFNLVFEVDGGLPWGMHLDITFLNQHYNDNTISDPTGYLWLAPAQINGCVDVESPEEFKADPNCNGVKFDLGDVVLVALRLIHGYEVWSWPEDINGCDDAAQEASADLNNNGFVDVADLVTFVNVLNHLIPPPYKLEPGSAIAEVSMPEVVGDDVDVTVSSELDIGGVLVSINHPGVELGTPVAQSGMELRYYDADDVLNVVVFSMDAHVITAGSSPLFTVPVVSNNSGSVSFGEVSSSDAYGNLLETVASLEAPLPTSYSVEQNYPNPFNAKTQIGFALPEGGDVSIEIYSITGQLVETISGNYEAGNHSVTWDASRVASGIYFYKLTAGDFSQTMKMTLLK